MTVACSNPEMEIARQIELTRSQMNRLADELGHVHPNVLRCSLMLDELLLKYYAINRRNLAGVWSKSS